jgi:hypothetical protein
VIGSALALLLSAAGCELPPDTMVVTGCQHESECDDENACTVDICEEGSCINQTDDSLQPTQIPGNCLKEVCRAGFTATEIDDTDKPSQTCETMTCVDGTARSEGPAADGLPCERDGNPQTWDICLHGECVLSVCGDGFQDPIAPHICLNGAAVLQSTDPSPDSLAAADLNWDGHIDMVVANQGGGTITVFWGHADGLFMPGLRYTMGGRPTEVALVPLTGESPYAILTTDVDTDTVSIRLTVEESRYVGPQSQVYLGPNTAPASLAIGDLDQNGALDVAVAAKEEDTVHLLFGDGQGGFTDATAVPVGPAPIRVAAAFLDNDWTVDLVTANQNDNTVTLLQGGGDGTFSDPLSLSVGDSPVDVVVADMDLDGVTDILTADVGSSEISVLRGLGNGAFAPREPLSLDYPPVALAAADVNGDGLGDLAVSLQGHEQLAFFKGVPSYTIAFGQAAYLDTVPASRPAGLEFTDLNKDGHLDLAVCLALPGWVYVLLANP